MSTVDVQASPVEEEDRPRGGAPTRDYQILEQSNVGMAYEEAMTLVEDLLNTAEGKPEVDADVLDRARSLIARDQDMAVPERLYGEAAVVEARNGTNAIRKAFKQLRAERGTDFSESTLAPVPVGQWKPTPVRAERKESITVAVGVSG